MNTFGTIDVKKVQNFFNKCEVRVDVNSLSGVQQHIAEKFTAYCEPRGIIIKALPSPYCVTLFSSNKGKTDHMACPAIYNGISGWVINLASKKDSKRKKYLKFVSEKDAACMPLKGEYNASPKKTKAVSNRQAIENAVAEETAE